MHSWDAWDSEKYIDIDEYLDAALGRIYKSFEDLLKNSPLAMKVEAAELASDAVESAEAVVEEVQEELPPNKIPVLTEAERYDNFLLRSTIYKYYFTHLNMWGQPYEEQGFQASPRYWVGHAHNIFLQFGTDFGIPVMFLLAILIIWGSIRLGKEFGEQQVTESAEKLLFLLVPVLFGMFEYSWGVGSLTMIMMFTAWRKVVCDEK